MKLEMGEQVRERPVIGDGVKEPPQNVKPELVKQLSLEEENTSVPQWNIPLEGGGAPLEQLMSQLTLNTTPRMRALRRLVRVALSRADRRELTELAETATKQSQPEFVRHLGKLLEKDARRQKDDRTAGQRATPTGELPQGQRATPKKRDLIQELKEDNDLCPRSPMRPQHHRPNTFPYQNTSRNHHSGGIMSAMACSDAIGPTPLYHDHVSFQSLGSVASRPPLIAECSNVPTETTLDDLDSMLPNLSEGDLAILMSLAVDLCPKIPTAEDEMFPESIAEINSASVEIADRRVPCDLFPPTIYPSQQRYQHDENSHGYASLSPASLPSASPGHLPYSPDSMPGHLPYSPDSMRVVPDDVAPNMSPPGQFFEDNHPLTSKYADNHQLTSNFEDNHLLTSNYDNNHPLTSNYEDNHLLTLNYEDNHLLTSNYEDKEVNGGYRSPGSSGYSSTSAPSPTDYPSANDFAHEDFAKLQIPANDYIYNLNEDFDSDYLLENVFESSPPNVASQPPASIFFGSRHRVPATNVVAEDANVPTAIAEFENVNASFAELTNAVVSATPPRNVDSVAAMPAKLTSLSVSNLKRLEPKVQHLLRPETGRERILKLMDKKKKAEAWVNISLKVNELTKQDKDGDTQLMILCATGSARGYVLEYTYAMVEMLKGVPRALAAVNNQRQSALYLAAMHSDDASRAIVVRYIAETLVELGEDIACTTEGGDSMLHELCRHGDQRYDVLVELLSLRNQAGQPYFDVNQYNAKGLTPLHVAAKSHGVNNVSMLMTVQLLMAERADIMLPDKAHSQTALHVAILESCAPRLIEALLRGGQTGRACNMLNLKRDSPLHCAASRNDLPVKQQMKVIQLLLEHGAVKSLNANGKFPIALVAEERRQEIRRVYETRKSNQANIGVM